MNEIDYAVLAMDVYNRVEEKGMFPDGQDVDHATVYEDRAAGGAARRGETAARTA